MRSLRRCSLLSTTVVLTIAHSLPALPALAQNGTGTGTAENPDLVPIVIWTLVVIAIAMAVTSVGYLYRREQGMDRPLTAPPVDAFAGEEGHDKTRDAAGHDLSGHVLQEHAAEQHDDATEQAQLLHSERHSR